MVIRSLLRIFIVYAFLVSAGATEAGDPITAEQELLGIPLYHAMSIHDPEAYQLILEQFKVIRGKKDSITDLNNEVRPVLQTILEERMPYASDVALREFAKLILVQTDALYNINPELCDIYLGAYLNENIDPKSIVSYFTSELAQKEQKVISNVIMSSYDNNNPPVDENKMEQLRLMVFDKVSAQHQNAGKVLTDIEYAIDNTGSFCVVNYALYEAMLELPEQQSGNLIRYIFSE